MSTFDNILDAFEEADYLVMTTLDTYAIVYVDDRRVAVLPLEEARRGSRRILEIVYGRG